MIDSFRVRSVQWVPDWEKSGTANRNQHPDAPLEDGQILMRKMIWCAIDDALRVPETDKLTSERRRTRLDAEDRERNRVGGIQFIKSDDFLGLYRYAFSKMGDWIRGKLYTAIDDIAARPEWSDYYRKIFSYEWSQGRGPDEYWIDEEVEKNEADSSSS